jgi:hypothetical protein
MLKEDVFMYVFNSWPGNQKIHKASCQHGPKEHSPVGEENPPNIYRLGPFDLQEAIDAAKTFGPVQFCKHCLKHAITETSDDR